MESLVPNSTSPLKLPVAAVSLPLKVPEPLNSAFPLLSILNIELLPLVTLIMLLPILPIFATTSPLPLTFKPFQVRAKVE
jgi:hypothetical protein